MLAYLAGNVGPSCGYVGLCWPHVDPCWAKRSQKGEQQKKHCKTQDILMVGGLSWGYVGPSWGYVGLSWGQCGPILGAMLHRLEVMWAHLGAMLAHLVAMLVPLGGYVGPSWGYVRPSWRLCWPMLTHLEPQAPKKEKKCEEHKTP